jgi:hypothetical protein
MYPCGTLLYKHMLKIQVFWDGTLLLLALQVQVLK